MIMLEVNCLSGPFKRARDVLALLRAEGRFLSFAEIHKRLEHCPSAQCYSLGAKELQRSLKFLCERGVIRRSGARPFFRWIAS